MKLRVSARDVYHPDVMVVCEEPKSTDAIVDRPRFVAEVLSPRTRRFDLVEKRAAYQTFSSLEAYLVAHADTRRAELDRRDAEGVWRTHFIDDGLLVLPGAQIPLRDLYERTSLADAS